MGDRWRTNASTPGSPSKLMDNGTSRQLDRAGVISGSLVIEEEPAPPRSSEKRYCQECGKEVCSYKDAYIKKVWCYAHDHLTPWTRPYIVGSEKKPKMRSVGKRGRPATTWFYS